MIRQKSTWLLSEEPSTSLYSPGTHTHTHTHTHSQLKNTFIQPVIRLFCLGCWQLFTAPPVFDGLGPSEYMKAVCVCVCVCLFVCLFVCLSVYFACVLCKKNPAKQLAGCRAKYPYRRFFARPRLCGGRWIFGRAGRVSLPARVAMKRAAASNIQKTPPSPKHSRLCLLAGDCP